MLIEKSRECHSVLVVLVSVISMDPGVNILYSGLPNNYYCRSCINNLISDCLGEKIGVFTVTRPTLSKTTDCKLFFSTFSKIIKQSKNSRLDIKNLRHSRFAETIANFSLETNSMLDKQKFAI